MASNRLWLVFLCATSSAGYLCRVNVSIAAPLFMTEFNLSEVQTGRWFSAFLAGYALCQAFGGLVADRWGPRKTLRLSSLLWVLLTIAFSFLGFSWWGGKGQVALILGMVLRFLLGLAQAPLFPTAAAAVALWIPAERRARSNAIVLAGVSIGSALAPLLVSGVMTQWGWRISLIVSVLPAAMVSFLWWRIRETPAVLPECSEYNPTLPRRSRQDNRPEEGALRSISFRLLCGSYTLQGYVGYIFVFWFYLYLVRVRHFNLLEGALFSSLPWVLSMVSIPLGGWISDRLSVGRWGPSKGKRIVPIFGLSGAGVLLVFGANTNSPYLAAAYLSLSTALILCVEGPFWAAATEIAGRRHAGVGGGIMNTGCNLGGMLSPIATPWLAERIGWEKALYVAAALSLLAALFWLGIRLPEQRATQY